VVSTIIPGGVIGFGNLTDPDMAYFFFDDVSLTNKSFTNGQIVGKFLFPLSMLNNGAETAVMTTLQVKNVCTGGTCSPQAQAVGGIGSPQNPVPASQLGISFALVWSTSPAAPNNTHAIFEWGIPLLVTGACQPSEANFFCLTGPPPLPVQTIPGSNTDPAYFYSLFNGKTNPVNTGVYTAFTFDDLGGPLSQGMSIGLAPSAGPLGPPPNMGGLSPPRYALCANLPQNGSGQQNGNAQGNSSGQALAPSVGAYYAIATSGEMFLSAPLPSAFTTPSGGTPPVCPPL
jgi:hypothetical protein